MKNIASSLIDLLPKAELHLHIEGTLEPEMLMQLAKRNKVELPYETVEEVKHAYDFSCLQDFLDLYYLGMSVLVTEQDFFDLTWAYLQKVHGDRLTHVEMFFDPQPHMDRGIAFDVVLGGITHALEVGRKEFGITSKLIMCFVRHLPEEHAFTALDCACNHKKEIFGVGMDSTEVGIPPRTFQRVFRAAVDQGFIPVAHVGEEGTADDVKEALDLLKIKRVDHGNHALDDAKLVSRLSRDQTPLTMCPISNWRLKVIDDLSQSPIKKALDAGLLVTINSDDPSYFGGYLNDNYRAVQQSLNLDEKDIITLTKNSFKASFLSDDEKQRQLDRVDSQVSRIQQS